VKRAIGTACLAISLLAGCAGKVAAPEQEASTSGSEPTVQLPTPDSPAHLVQMVAAHWNHLDWRGYGNLLTDDFQFIFAQSDSAGSLYRDRSFDRALEILVARHMFETGNASLPPFQRVSVTLGRLIAIPDPRPGKTFPAHQYIRTGFTLAADAESFSFRIYGSAGFFVVRGDSAAIPPDLRDRSALTDASHWWLERWEDETLEPVRTPQNAAMPGSPKSLGALKVLYR